MVIKKKKNLYDLVRYFRIAILKILKTSSTVNQKYKEGYFIIFSLIL